MTTPTLEQQIDTWVAGWNIGEKPFNAEVFRDVFAAGPGEIAVFDNVEGDVVVLDSVDAYVETWTPFMAPMSVWSIKLEDLNIRVHGDMAVKTFRIVGTDTRDQNGAPVPFGQYGTHVWTHSNETGWRIVHEHLTVFDAQKGLQS